MAIPSFTTARLLLRQIEEYDAEGLHAAYDDPEAMRFWDFSATRSVAETAALIKAARGGSLIRHGVWAILRRNGGFVGMINYHHREARHRRFELGWIVMPAYWREGLMTEAARPVLDFCFAQLQTHRIEALIEPPNVASRALARRLGFVQEAGLLRDRLFVDREFRSVHMYALLRPEWLARSGGGPVD